MDRVITLYGRPIEEFTKEELMKIIILLANENKRLLEQAQQDRDFLMGDSTK